MEVWHFHEYGCLAGGKFSWFWRVVLDKMFGGNDDFDKFFYLDKNKANICAVWYTQHETLFVLRQQLS